MADTPVVIPDAIRALIATAAADGHPIVAGSVDPDGQPELAYYGSVQPFEADSLAMWARPPAHVADRLDAHPKMSFLYWNRDQRTMARLYGTATVVEDQDRRNAIFEAAPQNEQARDEARQGVAIEIRLTRISGSVAGEPFSIGS
jgi:hypothetical protein